MATMAAQTYLIASFNFLVASQPVGRQLSTNQIIEVLYQMAEAEDIRSFQAEKRAALVETSERKFYRG